MIKVTRLNNTPFYLNAELVEQIESTPDTVITLMTGNNIIVKESVEEVVERIIEYRQKTSQKKKFKEEKLLSKIGFGE